MRDVDIFGDDDARRHVAAVIELIGAGAQHRAQDRLDALERPGLRQRVVDQRIELALLAHHAADDVAEERGLRRQILLAFDLAADPVALELGQDLVQAGRRRCPSGRAPAPRRAAPRRAGWPCAPRMIALRHARYRDPALEADERERRARGIAALVALVELRAFARLRIGVDGDDAVADRDAARDRQVHQRARRFKRHDLEMQRLAADDAAEPDRAVERLAGALGGIERDRDRRRHFQRTRHADALVGARRPPRWRGRRRPAAHRRCRRRSAPRRSGGARPCMRRLHRCRWSGAARPFIRLQMLRSQYKRIAGAARAACGWQER